jgi:hypothetical protein
VKAIAKSADGVQFELRLEHGRGRDFADWVPQGDKDFPYHERLVFLTVKGNPWTSPKVYERIREVATPIVGKPISMPITSVSHLAIFAWQESAFHVGDQEMLNMLRATLETLEVGNPPPRSDAKSEYEEWEKGLDTIYHTKERAEQTQRERERVIDAILQLGIEGVRVRRDRIDPDLVSEAERMVGDGFLKKTEKQEGWLTKDWVIYYELTDSGKNEVKRLRALRRLRGSAG